VFQLCLHGRTVSRPYTHTSTCVLKRRGQSRANPTRRTSRFVAPLLEKPACTLIEWPVSTREYTYGRRAQVSTFATPHIETDDPNQKKGWRGPIEILGERRGGLFRLGEILKIGQVASNTIAGPKSKNLPSRKNPPRRSPKISMGPLQPFFNSDLRSLKCTRPQKWTLGPQHSMSRLTRSQKWTLGPRAPTSRPIRPQKWTRGPDTRVHNSHAHKSGHVDPTLVSTNHTPTKVDTRTSSLYVETNTPTKVDTWT